MGGAETFKSLTNGTWSFKRWQVVVAFIAALIPIMSMGYALMSDRFFVVSKLDNVEITVGANLEIIKNIDERLTLHKELGGHAVMEQRMKVVEEAIIKSNEYYIEILKRLPK